ncbi:MAG: hypothetical protein ACRDKI_03250 [Solirubrobacterales bacterium]
MNAIEYQEFQVAGKSRSVRARRQRALGVTLMSLLLAFIFMASVWTVSEVQYRNCLSRTDKAYAAASGIDHITWPPSKSAAAAVCATTNRVQDRYLR